MAPDKYEEIKKLFYTPHEYHPTTPGYQNSDYCEHPLCMSKGTDLALGITYDCPMIAFSLEHRIISYERTKYKAHVPK